MSERVRLREWKIFLLLREGNHVFRSVELKESLGCGFCLFNF